MKSKFLKLNNYQFDIIAKFIILCFYKFKHNNILLLIPYNEHFCLQKSIFLVGKLHKKFSNKSCYQIGKTHISWNLYYIIVCDFAVACRNQKSQPETPYYLQVSPRHRRDKNCQVELTQLIWWRDNKIKEII